MIPRSLRCLLLAVAVILPNHGRAGDEPAVRIGFSVHLLPPEGSTGDSELEVIGDLRYAHGKLEIPLHLKEGRQSILYPYAGPRRLTLFRTINQDGEATRQAVCHADIPSGTKAAILILQCKGGNYRVKPFWFNQQKLREPGVLANISTSTIGIRLGKRKRSLLSPGRSILLRPAFPGGERHAYLFMEGFLSETRNKNVRWRKALETNLFFPKGDAQLNLLFLRSPRQLSAINLSTRGIPNREARAELEKLIPAP